MYILYRFERTWSAGIIHRHYRCLTLLSVLLCRFWLLRLIASGDRGLIRDRLRTPRVRAVVVHVHTQRWKTSPRTVYIISRSSIHTHTHTHTLVHAYARIRVCMHTQTTHTHARKHVNWMGNMRRVHRRVSPSALGIVTRRLVRERLIFIWFCDEEHTT